MSLETKKILISLLDKMSLKELEKARDFMKYKQWREGLLKIERGESFAKVCWQVIRGGCLTFQSFVSRRAITGR